MNLSSVANVLKKMNKVAVPLNNSNLWKLGNTNYLNEIAKKARTRKYSFFAGDWVRVTRGKEQNKTGKLLAIIPELDQVIVEGVHVVAFCFY